MLIIGMPKAATTSVAATLAEHIGCDWKQRHLDYPRAAEFMHLPHRDVLEYPADVLLEFEKSSMLYKQHIPPTAGNLDAIVGHRIRAVLLLRSPEPAFEAYARHRRPSGRLRPLRFTELEAPLARKELRLFFDRYLSVSHRKHLLLIHFEELVRGPDPYLREAMAFLGHPLPKGTRIQLKKLRYNPPGTVAE